jgi:hypothetical protein
MRAIPDKVPSGADLGYRRPLQIRPRQHVPAVMAAAKSWRDRYLGLVAKAKTMLQGAAAKRLQISADNAADSYARSMRQAAEAGTAKKRSRRQKNDPAIRLRRMLAPS